MFSYTGLVSRVNQLKCGLRCVRVLHTGQFLTFRLTPAICAEPLKKKKKIDPAILKLRDDRKRRKIEKQIRKLEKVGQKLKPIDEVEVPPKVLEEKKLRIRKVDQLSEDEIDYRAAIYKEWSRFKHQQHDAELTMIDSMLAAQKSALEELKLVSEELYEAALQPDSMLEKAFTANGPVNTPPLQNYGEIDGEYSDVTKKWN